MDPLGHTIKGKPNRRHSTFFFASLKLGEDFQHGKEGEKTIFTLSQDSSIKPWNSVDNLDSPFSSQKATMIEPQKSISTLRSSKMININVGGKVFHLEKCMVVKYPRTRIGNLVLCTDRVRQLTMCDDYSVCTDEFFFDRDPSLFLYVYHFYRSGVLWTMNKLCPVNFEEELKYWGVSLKETERCCHILFEEKVDELKECLKIERELMAEIEPKHDEEGFKSMYFGSFRKALWDLMENPYSSISAKFFAVFSSLFVLISIVAMTLNTVQDMKTTTVRGRTYLECVEIASILFFTVEYFLRLLTTCDIKHFLKSALNFVDLVAVMPYFIQLVFETFADREDLGVREDLQAMARVSKVSKVLKVVKLMRIFRILKLARHSTGMRAFGFTIRQCYQQVCCLFLFITMGIFTFSALMYSVEHDVAGTHFSSIPDAWWWAAVSISTVGYGDVVPVSFLGRVVAFLCISFGIILNGMPISILFNKFSDYYAKLKAQEEAHTKVQRSLNFTARLSRKLDHCLHPHTEDSDDLILH